MQVETAHQKSKYEKLNKYFTKRKTSKEESVVLDNSSYRDSSSIYEYENYYNEAGKISINYDSDSADDDKSSSSSIRIEDYN